MATIDSAPPTTSHPLDPLSEAEVRTAAEAVRRHALGRGELTFAGVTLLEPDKRALALHDGGGPSPERRARAIAYRPSERLIVEAVVALDDEPRIVEARELEGAFPPVGRRELELVARVVPADAGWQHALRRRGVDDLGAVEIHPWPPGTPAPEFPGRRISRAITYLRHGPDDSVFARPIEGLVAKVDLDTGEVLAIQDTGAVPVPTRSGHFAPEHAGDPGNAPVLGPPHDDVRALDVVQPAGPSFELHGRELRWQRWSLHVGFTHREGVVLHRVRYHDKGRERSILHRAALSEMWVPYGDPGATHVIKNVFDEGEVGLGPVTNPLELGCDCLGEIRYLDAVVSDQGGEPLAIPNAVCIHEEDTGVAWKHTDDHTARVEVRRGRRLVISSFVTIGNYDHGFSWSLHTDGTIAFEVKLTGVPATGAVAPGQRPPYGTIVAPGLHGPNH